ncbi:MAG: hypothetical protein LBB72_07900 [Spirochaetaceae bacterium]|jgi:hypothetical protein|nr:hypothetical protein [Spirochaetaceae bacterium]
MVYKKKLIILGASAVFLALVYLVTLFFDPSRINARNERFTWLPPGAREEADKIEISGSSDEKFELVLRHDRWFALLDGTGGPQEVPVKQGRVDDIFRLLGTRGAFPRRGSSASSHKNLGLTTDGYRLIIRGGAGLPLLDLLIGQDDVSGKEVFLRKNGENEFRSGDRLIGSYVKADKNSWYDLKLFDEASVEQVQRVRVTFLDYSGPEDETPLIGYIDYNITRSAENWIMEGDSTPLDKDKTETWIRGILEVQGDNFLSPQNDFTAARIVVELGDGSTLRLQIGEAIEDGKAPALTGNKPYVYSLPRWTATRILRERGYFN